ncbi:MAG TPA: hypothetical protein VL053_02840, partial [Arachidicoccus sp.]|nr:hypothetical protein [Arachidicoccus sp.]
MKRTFTFFAIFAALLLWAQTTHAQYTKLFDFNGNVGLHPGSMPQYTQLLSDGNFLYGMTLNGGAGGYGNIFKV